METRPKFRDDLIIRENVKEDGSRYYVIKDPVTNAFFKVGEAEYFIILQFDGQRSVPEIGAAFRLKFQAEIDNGSIGEFVSQLQALCFLDNDLTRQELLRKQRAASLDQRTLFQKILFIKLKAINPGKLFDRLIRYTGFFFTRRFVWVASLLFIFSFLVTLYNIGDIADSAARLLSLKGILIFYIAMFLVIVLHEFAHGLTCTHFGGRVQDIGFLLIYFQPAFYCNVSDAWLFPEKRKKLWVSFAGGFFQLFIWAVAVLVWRIAAPDTFINMVAVAVVSFTGIATLFNFNPLLKYDGYYILSDWLEIPNLRKRAGLYWRGLWRKIFLGAGPGEDNSTSRERRIYFYYGLFSFLYVVFILGYFFLLLGRFLVTRLGGTGFLIFAALLVFLFRNILMDLAKGVGELVAAKKSAFKRPTTWVILGVLAIGLFLLVFVARWELRIKGDLILSPQQSILLKYSSSGYAEVVRYDGAGNNPGQQRQVSAFSGDYTTTRLLPLVAAGDTVMAGQVIARLVNTETMQLINENKARLKGAREELALLREGPRPQEIEEARNAMNECEAQLKSASQEFQRKSEMLAKNLISRQEWEKAQTDSLVWDAKFKATRSRLWMLKSGSRPEEIRTKEAEITRLQGQIDFHTKQLESYEIKSDISGMVIRIDTGETVCEIAAIDTMEAKITLSEKELGDIAIGQKVKFKVRSYPALSFFGEVARIDNKIVVDARGNRIFEVTCRVPNSDHMLKPGMTGVANVYGGKKKIGFLIYRKFFRTIRTEFWDWFDWL